MYLRLTDKTYSFCVIAFSMSGITLHAAEKNQVLTTQQDVQKEAEDLAIVKKFVHRQLRKNNTPAPESFNLAFHPSKMDIVNGYGANLASKKILVPRDLATLITERFNKDKLQNVGEFGDWYNSRGLGKANIPPVYNNVYGRIAPTIRQMIEQEAIETAAGRYDVSDATFEKIKNMIISEEKNLYRWGKGSALHEAGHILEKHTQKKEQFNLVSMPTAFASSSVAGMGMSYRFNLNGVRTLGIFSTFTACSLATRFLLIKALSRKYEREADAYVPDKPKILHAMAKVFSDDDLRERGMITQHNNRFLNIFNTHPIDKERARYFDMRAKKLEQVARDKTKN